MAKPCWLLLLPLLITLHGLVTGAGWLTLTTPGWSALPLGNLATWASLVGLGLLALCRHPLGWRRGLALTATVFALAWGPLSRLVTGNWAFSGGGSISEVPWAVASGATVTGLLLVALIASFVGSGRRRDRR